MRTSSSLALLLSAPSGVDAFATTVRCCRAASGIRPRLRSNIICHTIRRRHFISSGRSEIVTPTLSAVHYGHDNDVVETLLDESVLLYTKLSRESTAESDIEVDILDLRRRELSQLIQDAVAAAVKDSPSPLISSFIDDDTTSVVAELVQETQQDGPQTLMEISTALDKAILQGYQSTFSGPELDEWVEEIDALFTAFQAQLNGSAPADKNSLWSSMKSMVPLETSNGDGTSAREATNPVPTDIPTNDTVSSTRLNEEFQTRLENLRILIDPVGTIQSRRIPVVPAVDILIPPTATKARPSGLKNMKEPYSPRLTSLAAPSLSQKASISVPSTVQSEITNRTKQSTARGLSYEDKYDRDPDILSAILSVAAIGAAAVTQSPFFVAGIGLGPAIRNSIAYARKKAKKPPQLTADDEEGTGSGSPKSVQN